ncbi:N-acetylmuramoyl-L-alanine amidase [Nocardioides sp. cx-169]|uniref:peptidoglycan recognition protein family protein n=1 Tax=Nocardioides sp. cx-169 TaxID=2899080 RepID=UPI001E492155|nr:N-acetylmuramoyl-L-alanine amidase [Nocardioides sp. cx-169]MCD4535631.1 N-acetylmuramoyl-L-alanine amidase [Nocardioides sp. cx-169]
MLTDLADACRKSGLNVIELSGWRTRARPASTGGFDPRGVLVHHTGGASDTKEYALWMAATGRADLPAPLCQLALDRKGTVYVCAAGRANHGGDAKATGPMPAGDGNALYIGIEAMNDGSEGWAPTQYAAYVALCAALCDHYGWPASHVRAHRETSLTGKWDPGLLDMDKFRNDIAARLEEDEMNADEIRKIIREEINASKLDVGRKHEWSEDTVAETLVNRLGRIETLLTKLLEGKGK